MDVGQAIVESRGLKDDQKDHRTVDSLRRKRALGGRLHLDHVGGPTEPMLWARSDKSCELPLRILQILTRLLYANCRGLV